MSSNSIQITLVSQLFSRGQNIINKHTCRVSLARLQIGKLGLAPGLDNGNINTWQGFTEAPTKCVFKKMERLLGSINICQNYNK